MSHTPGPWRKLNAPESSNDAYWIEPDDRGTIVASIQLNSERGYDERTANARLIAAAPELLAACQSLVDYLVESHQDEFNNDHYGDNPDGCTYCQAIHEGGSAIAKAIGSGATNG